MANNKDYENKLTNKFILTGVIITIIFLILIISTSMKIYDNDICDSERTTIYTGKALQESSIILDEVNEYYLQEIPVYKLGEKSFYCFEGRVRGSNGLIVSVINEELEVIGQEFLYNNITSYCARLSGLSNNNKFLVLMCEDCDSNNNITMKQEITGEKNLIAYYNGSINVYDEENIKTTLSNEYSCKGRLKTLITYYLIIISIIILIILIIRGYKFIEDQIEED